MPPDQTNEVLHIRLTHLEQAHAEMVSDVKAMRLDVTSILIQMKEHNAKSCPQPGLCIAVQNDARTLRKDIDEAHDLLRKQKEELDSLKGWRTGLTYAGALITGGLTLWLSWLATSGK